MHVRRTILGLLLLMLLVVAVAGFGASWKWKKGASSEAGWTWDERVQSHFLVD